jgi:hypothetical protein
LRLAQSRRRRRVRRAYRGRRRVLRGGGGRSLVGRGALNLPRRRRRHVPRDLLLHAQVNRRKFNVKANLESSLSYCSFKR